MEPTTPSFSSRPSSNHWHSNDLANSKENELGTRNQADRDHSEGKLSHLYRPITHSLDQIERRLEVELESRYEVLNEVLRHGTRLSGKRMRPAMVLLAGAAAGEISDDHVVMGTVIEMVHMATLIHDDVLDAADVRRHIPTINATWNGDVSILLGDFLFAHSFYLAATLGDTTTCQWIGEAARRVCEGELLQILNRNVFDIGEADYIEMIRGKTAELCCVACRLGAHRAGASESTVDALARYGDAMGIAFQIADDYLDLWGDESTVGKTLGTDLKQGKVTLPLIRMLSACDLDERKAVLDAITGPENQRESLLRPMLQRSDAKEYTRRFAKMYCEKAIESLNCIEPSEAKNSLVAIAKFSVNRTF